MWYNGHKFDFKRSYEGTEYYSCTKYGATKCLAKLIKYPADHKKAKRARLLDRPDQHSNSENEDQDSRSDASASDESSVNDVDYPSPIDGDRSQEAEDESARDGSFIEFRGEHTCTATETAPVRDVTDEMAALIRQKASEDLIPTASAVWEWARQQMITRYGRATGLNLIKKRAGRDLAYRARDASTGGDAFRAIEMPPHRFLSTDDHRPFLQFNISYTHECELHRLIGFAQPGLLHLLNHPGIQLFIDGTFSIAPRPFKQVVIAMVYDHGHNIFVPVFYALAQAKTDWTYWHILHWIKVQSGMKLNPGVVCCDFELALLQSVKDQFPDANRVGCLFHWKQAIRWKMIVLHIPRDQVQASMRPGCLDLLTVLPRPKMDQGIAHVSSQLEPRRGDKTKWASFWKYFRATWLKRYDLDTWNVHHMLRDKVDLIAKTNNPLESYNRVFASQFHRSHPNLMTFMQVCKNESQRFFERLRRIKDGVEDGSDVADVTYPTIPAELAD